jgi:hypothetical protein
VSCASIRDGPLAVQQPLDTRLDPQVGRDRILALGCVQRGGEVLDHVGGLGLRQAAHPDRGQQRQRVGEVGHEVGLSASGEGVDEVVGDALAVPPQLELVHFDERVTDRAGPPLVLGPLGEQHRRLVADEGHQRPVRRDALPGVPAPRVPGEELVVGRDVVQLPVAEDQPRRDAAVEQDGGHRTVPAPHVLVEAGRGLLEGQTAEGHRVRVVGGAAGGGFRDGGRAGGLVGHWFFSRARDRA